jgi:CubicO group peptidase (beta-lactamase class C family)
MGIPLQDPGRLSRRGFLAASLAGCAAAGTGDAHAGHGDAFAELDEKILQGMRDFSIPGVAVGVIHRGREYLRGYGVTDLGDPRPVDADTVFRIASTSKTFTGTAAMRLVDAGLLSLEERVDRYLPDFRPPPGAGPVTVRQLLVWGFPESS